MGIVFGTSGKVCVLAGGDDAGVAEKILHILQTDAGFDQMSGVGVPQTMGRGSSIASCNRCISASMHVIFFLFRKIQPPCAR